MTRVAVVGAGIAGLGAAYALQEAGLEVIVLEKAAVPGGRMQTRSEQGYTWEAGAQFLLDDQYVHMKRLLRKLGIPLSAHRIPSVTAIVLPDGRLWYIRMGRPLDLLRHPALRPASRWRLGKVFLAAWRHRRHLHFHHPELAAGLDTESVRQWGDREVGPDAVDFLLSVPFSTFFFWRPEETSLWCLLGIAGLQGAWKVVVPEGGLGAVTAALARRLDVRLQTTVERVEIGPDGRVTLRIADRGGAAELVVDRVILATSAPVTLALLADPDRALGRVRADFVRSIRYVSNLTTAVGYRRAPETRAYGISIPIALGHPVAAIEWTHTKGPDRAPAGHGLAVVMPTHAWSVANARHPDEAVAADLVAAVDSLYPGNAAEADFHRVVRWEHAIPVAEPGWASRLAAALAAGPAPGSPVFACGDYWAGPSTEWALMSGWQAAAELLQSLGRSIPPEYAVAM
ncbi:MAG: FAD-dependent oxidoreductase [Bacillota bacterium]|nr:MAG: hypothetical protein DIU70_02850 [Bacillota bacterium]